MDLCKFFLSGREGQRKSHGNRPMQMLRRAYSIAARTQTLFAGHAKLLKESRRRAWLLCQIDACLDPL